MEEISRKEKKEKGKSNIEAILYQQWREKLRYWKITGKGYIMCPIVDVAENKKLDKPIGQNPSPWPKSNLKSNLKSVHSSHCQFNLKCNLKSVHTCPPLHWVVTPTPLRHVLATYPSESRIGPCPAEVDGPHSGEGGGKMSSGQSKFCSPPGGHFPPLVGQWSHEKVALLEGPGIPTTQLGWWGYRAPAHREGAHRKAI